MAAGLALHVKVIITKEVESGEILTVFYICNGKEISLRKNSGIRAKRFKLFKSYIHVHGMISMILRVDV